MDKKKFTILGILIAMALVATGCYFPDVISSDDYIATEVADSLEDVLEKTAAAEVQATYTPYPTYTPAPTYTPQQYYYTFDQDMPPMQPGEFDNRMPPMPRR